MADSRDMMEARVGRGDPDQEMAAKIRMIAWRSPEGQRFLQEESLQILHPEIQDRLQGRRHTPALYN